MRLGLSLIVGILFATQVVAESSEGRVDESPMKAPDAGRVSNYSGTHLKAGMPANSAKTSRALAAKAAPIYRSADKSMSARAAYFRLYDASRILRTDRDQDGHYSEFRIRFDADASFGDALVYARLYIRRVGDTGNWRLYHETEDFWIYSQSGSDDYYVDTVLDEGFATGNYDVLVDLYESGYSGIVATLGPADSAALEFLPLEEVGLDVPFGLPGYAINDVASTLNIDADHDGFYSKFKIDFDPDTNFGDAWVYAVIWVRSQGGEWIKEHESEDFQIDASGTADSYGITADWISGYPTGRYDVQIDLHDATSGVLVASAGSEWPELSRLPLEDQSQDLVVNSPQPSPGGGVTSSREHGGGSWTFGWALMFLGFAFAKRWVWK
ncbi:MAG TPA: choice-of-anchor H family protein [Steroidobacteraceae bacterium]|nr:choice-of-anchor H family protein [Steroidobacteraceae bacterium]